MRYFSVLLQAADKTTLLSTLHSSSNEVVLYYISHVSHVLLLVAKGPFTSYIFVLTLAMNYLII